MAEGGRHLPKSDQVRSGRPARRQSARQEPVWEEEEEYVPPRRSQPARQQPAPPARSVRYEPDWEEEPAQPRRQPAQSRQDARYDRAPQQDPYYYDDQDRAPQRAPRYDRARQQDVYYYDDRGRAPRQDARYGRMSRQEQYSYDRPPQQPRSRRVEVAPPAYRRRRRGQQSLPLIILVVILVAGVVVAGGKLVSVMLNYQRDRSAYNTLADQALSSLAEPEATLPPGATPDPNAGQQTTVQSEVPFQVDWDLLRSQNSDVIGWIYDPGGISYPVMQTSDNEFYLHRGWDKQPNTAGSLFADPSSTAGVIHSNFIIWGHNMKDGSMFACLQKYVDQTYYEQHPVMYYMTPTQNYRIDLIAAHIVESTWSNFPGYFANDTDYSNYLNQITSSSFFWTKASVSTSYQLITMSTCDYSANYNDPRFLVHGMLVPIE